LDDAHLGFLLLQSKHTFTQLIDHPNSYLVIRYLKEFVKDRISFIIRDVGIEELRV